MKDEIKEILNNWKYVINNRITVYGETIGFKQIELLLDYITNLQKIEQDHQKLNSELREENKKLNNIIKGFDLYFKKMVDDRTTEEISQLGMTAYIEYNCLCIVKSFYEQLKDETDEKLKELEKGDKDVKD